MTRLNILTAKRSGDSSVLTPFLTPLLINRAKLQDMGVTFRILYDDDDALYDADVVFIESRIFRRWGRELQDQRAFDLIEKLRQRVGSVLWVDTTDSTGTTQFQFLPHVDGYFKTHLLADRSAYTKSYYGARIFTDYYHSRFGVDDLDESYCPVPAQESDLWKIRLAWNDSLGDFGPWGHYVRKLRGYVRVPLFYSTKFERPGERAVDISARFTTAYARETVAFQRQMVKRTLDSLGIATDKISKRAYLKELRSTKVAVSPFGWGEYSTKDYEVIINGAALVKPDMSHLETWPDLYMAGETYLPFKWDCSDLADVLESAMEGDRWREIATQAQTVYRKHLLEPEARETFCNRILDMVAPAPSPVLDASRTREEPGADRP